MNKILTKCLLKTIPSYDDNYLKLEALYSGTMKMFVMKMLVIQRNIKSWDQQNYPVIREFCYIRPLYNEVPLYFIFLLEHDWNQWSMTEIRLKSVEHDWNQTEISGAWLKSVEHDWNQWKSEVSGAWLKSDWNQWSMTEIKLKSVEHDWSQWSMTEISGAWLKSVEHDWSQWSIMLHWFSHAPLISVMLHWFQSDFSHAPMISVMLHWLQSCSTDFSHAPLISVWFQSDFSHAPLISVMLLNKAQFGFRPGHSTGAALASLTHPWHCAIDIGQIVCAIYLDLKRAFDTVAIFILLCKLRAAGCSEKALLWFKSYMW